MHVGEISCNSEKRFDSVNYKMLSKLHFSSIQEIAGKCFRSYPMDGKQKVQIFSQTGKQ